MKRTAKRVLSFILAGTFVFAAVPTAVQAVTPPEDQLPGRSVIRPEHIWDADMLVPVTYPGNVWEADVLVPVNRTQPAGSAPGYRIIRPTELPEVIPNIPMPELLRPAPVPPAPAQPAPAPAPAPVPPAPEPAPAPAPEPPAQLEGGLPTATAAFTPGTHVVTAMGYHSTTPLTVSVTFSADQITDITLVDHEESMYGSGWFFRAYPGVPDQILVQQSTNGIDAFSGATLTRNAVIEAVEEAIVLAGADPAQLEPQTITAPLPGDRFIPGFVEVTVSRGTDREGHTKLYNDAYDMNLRVSFGRNEFHVHHGGGRGLGQGGVAGDTGTGGHGESMTATGGLTLETAGQGTGGGTWGGYWFRQVVQHQFNDRQSTLDVDIVTGATMSAAAIRYGLEQAITQQGGNWQALTPRTVPPTQLSPNPATPDAAFFVPGIYTVTVEGYIGPMEVSVTLDRTTIRRIVVDSHTETQEFFDMVWGTAAGHVLRNAIYFHNANNLDLVDTVSGATATSQAIIDAVQMAMDLADVR